MERFATNMSVTNCNFKNENRDGIFKFKPEPTSQSHPDKKDQYLFLNSDSYLNMYDTNFYKINSKEYDSSDPRLISLAHDGAKISLDKPPLFGEVKLKDIYTDPLLDNYGKRYRNYGDIKVGQIAYYVDKSIAGSYYQPNFINESMVLGKNYVDPMDSQKPSYERLRVIDKKQKGYKHGLSFLDDTCETREDLMSTQMNRMNRQKYESRWT